MNFLSIESATNNPSVALYNNNSCVCSYFLNNNSSELPSKIKEIISDNNFNINNLDYIAITIGPGSYTGIRVGLSLAQGLAYSLNIPLLPINTMDILYSLAYSKDNVGRIIGFPAYKDKLLYFTIKDSTYNKKYNIKLSEIDSFEGKTIHGFGLSSYKDIINYKKIDFSAQIVGEYSIDNYTSLHCEDIGSISPIYLDEFLIS